MSSGIIFPELTDRWCRVRKWRLGGRLPSWSLSDEHRCRDEMMIWKTFGHCNFRKFEDFLSDQ